MERVAAGPFGGRPHLYVVSQSSQSHTFGMGSDLEQLKWNQDGLVPAIVQSELGGEVRMMAWCDRQALSQTMATGEATFYSRSRKQIWRKGESSGNTIAVHSVWVDCDGDTLIFLADPNGPSCHTGKATCFFRQLGETETSQSAKPIWGQLVDTLAERKQSTGEQSYTKRLLDAGVEKINAKITEEAGELCDALVSESDERVASEAADLLYHVLVGLTARGVDPDEVMRTLRARFGTSGLEEKAKRTRQ